MKAVRRHKAEGGYPRGEETRARIISAALALFGERGFDGVSTREIATQANVPPPSLQYYFENKQGLYLACIEHIQATALDAIEPALESAEELLNREESAERLIDAYCGLLDSLVDFLLGGPEAASRALFMARHAMPLEESAAQRDVHNATGRRMQQCFTRLAARIADRSSAEEEVRLMVMTINGQLLGIYLAQNHLKRLTGWESLTPKRLQTLKRLIRRQTTILLNTYHQQA